VLSAATDPRAGDVEIVVSDNSLAPETEQVANELLERWPGPTTYVRNVPSVGMVGNFNRCIELSTGRWVQILHDDDYLMPGGLEGMLSALDAMPEDQRVALFGVRVVTDDGRQLRRQVSRRPLTLEPAAALKRHLTWSSFVRFPAIVVRRDAYEHVGPFDAGVGGATDLDMWSRLFATYGLHLDPTEAVAYVVHPDAATELMFTDDYIVTIDEIFDRALALGVLPEREVRRAQAHWYHQFVLAGTLRRIRARERRAARKVLRLLRHSELADLPISWRWLPLRAAFSVGLGGGTRGRPDDELERI
jgi:glycosyltransferase involved in cell wall biosynthesis